MVDARPFDLSTLQRAFGRLGQLAANAGRVIEISVYDGSALVLTQPFRVSTRDVDAVFHHDPEFIRRTARQVANEFGWSEDWINDGVKGFLSASDQESSAKSLFRSFPSETGPGLRVFVATPAYLFAMKCLAMRIGGSGENDDISDIRQLGAVLGIKNAEEAISCVARYYPAERIAPKTRFGLEEIFGARKDTE